MTPCFRSFARVLFVCVAASPVATAYADTVELVCAENGVSSQNDRYVSVDLSASTVASGYTRDNRNGDAAAPATITNDQVAWAEPVNQNIKYLLDRRNGVLTATGSKIPWNCMKASRAF